MLALQLTVKGRVQGVGFRWWAQGVARQLGLAGRVRNLPDGRVEILAQGEPDAVRTMLRLAIEVPSTTSRPGWVDDYAIHWTEPETGRLGFFAG
jgi:acylphosphatase